MNRPTAPWQWQQNRGAAEHAHARLSVRARIGILVAVWVVALVPLLFVRTEWFGRPLSDQQIGEYLHAEQPNLVEHALTQISERMTRRDASVKIWYTDLLRLTGHPSAQVRALDATVMGNDVSQHAFHDALRPLLADPSRVVRFRAAASLARFGDGSGHDEIIAAVQPWSVVTPQAGRIREVARLETWEKQAAVVARIDSDGHLQDLLTPVGGRVSTVNTKVGDSIEEGIQVLQIDPGPEVIGDVLTALAQVGNSSDLPLITAMEGRAMIPQRVRQQALLTEKSIQARYGATDATKSTRPPARH